jgi:hypothetical protein
VRGELGEVQDVWRERKRKLLLARQMLNSPDGSMMARIAHQANSASPKWGIFRHVESFLTGVNSGRRRRLSQHEGHQGLDTRGCIG